MAATGSPALASSQGCQQAGTGSQDALGQDALASSQGGSTAVAKRLLARIEGTDQQPKAKLHLTTLDDFLRHRPPTHKEARHLLTQMRDEKKNWDEQDYWDLTEKEEFDWKALGGTRRRARGAVHAPFP